MVSVLKHFLGFVFKHVDDIFDFAKGKKLHFLFGVFFADFNICLGLNVDTN